MNKRSIIIMAVLTAALFGIPARAEMYTEFEDGVANASNVYAAARGKIIVRSVEAQTDKLGATVKFYARPTTLSKIAPGRNHASGSTNILLTNTGTIMTGSDIVVYQHADGVCDVRTLVGTCTTTNIFLDGGGISATGTNGDYIYEVSLQGQILAGEYGTGSGTNNTISRQDCFATPGDSPLYILLDGTADCVLMSTVEK